MSKFQLKIVGVLALLIMLVVAVIGVLAERGLRDRATDTIRVNLERQARLVRQMVDPALFASIDAPRLQQIARGSAESSGARVTIVDFSGRVLADSEVPEADVGKLENHSDRPEIIAAIAKGTGSSIRYSDTLRRDLLYVAIPVSSDKAAQLTGVVRLALNLGDVDAAAAALRRELLLAGVVGLVAALALSFLLSALSLRPIRELRDVVADIADGKLDRRLRWDTADERVEIASSINQMSRQLRGAMERAIGEKAQLEAVLASMVEGVVVIDCERKLLLINPRGRELLSVWGDYEGRGVPEVIRSPEVDRAIQDAATSDQIVVREVEVHAEKARTLLMHASGFPGSQPRAGTVVVFHDVTELRRVDQVRRDFIANASHELRTPLTSIGGFADTLASGGATPEEEASYLDVIVRNVKRMSDLIDDLLALSRIESGASQLELVQLDASHVAKSVLVDFGPRFAEASIDANLDVRGDGQCIADRGALEQILANLIGNAARYSNAGAQVDVTLETKGAQLEIRVSDTGIGIPEQDLERIFERFYRVDAARSRVLGSTGLGLSIVKHLVGAMNGEIYVESRLGQGSTFVFRLPVA